MSVPAALAQPKKHPPLPNSYWVVPGRLLAGEHPGARTLSDTTDRLQALLFAGVTLFIDLTEEGEAPSYDHLLIYAAGAVPLKYERHEIPDHDVPASPQVMQSILETIDLHLAQQGVVYVHCSSGIGRTGTVIGCYLVRLGLDGTEGLDRLNEVWCESERSHTCPRVPETPAQVEYVKNWASGNGETSNPSTSSPSISGPSTSNSPDLDRYTGTLIGMAIGEALGALVTVERRASASKPVVDGLPKDGLVKELTNGGPRDLPRGAWLSDTAMCWCLAESYLTCNGGNPEDQMRRYQEWQRDGKYVSAAGAHDVPAEVGKALAQWQWTRKPIAGSQDPNNLDAHALARTAAVVLFCADNSLRALQEAAESARTTLQAPMALDANRLFATLLLDALQGVEKETILSLKQSDNAQRLRQGKFKFPILQIMDGWWRGPIPPARLGTNVLAVLQTALWAFERTDDFREGVVLAANLCGNPTSSGAVFGALAGAYYGVQGIPQEWRSAILQAQPLADLAYRLATRIK